MQRIDLQASNSAPNFIGSWIIEPDSLCGDLIEFFDNHPEEQKQGSNASSKDLSVKDRMDITISPNQLLVPGNEVFKTYIEGLFVCYKDYLVQWPFLSQIGRNLEIGKFNLAKYEHGQHFQKLHTERSGLSTLHRVLAWMTYLNDVEQGGSTYFNHYDLDIKPKKGLTLLWPAEWTHSHKGNVLKSGLKYIITGWLTFPK